MAKEDNEFLTNLWSKVSGIIEEVDSEINVSESALDRMSLGLISGKCSELLKMIAAVDAASRK